MSKIVTIILPDDIEKELKSRMVTQLIEQGKSNRSDLIAKHLRYAFKTPYREVIDIDA